MKSRSELRKIERHFGTTDHSCAIEWRDNEPGIRNKIGYPETRGQRETRGAIARKVRKLVGLKVAPVCQTDRIRPGIPAGLLCLYSLHTATCLSRTIKQMYVLNSKPYLFCQHTGTLKKDTLPGSMEILLRSIACCFRGVDNIL